jgi:hypothetical protein
VHPPNRRRQQHPVNRRRPRPAPARDPFVHQQLRRAGAWLRALPRRLQDALAKPDSQDSASFGQIPQPWDGHARPTPADPEIEIVVDAPAKRPILSQHAADLGRRATHLGRQLAPHAVQFGRQLAPLARRGALATGRGMRATARGLRPLLRLLRSFFAAVGDLTFRAVAGLGNLLNLLRHGLGALVTRHQAVLFGLFTRALWWGALALLVLGGQAMVEIHGRAPLDQQALPAFAVGLGVCALLVMIAAQARLRWAALILGFSHGGLLALVWVVSAAIQSG